MDRRNFLRMAALSGAAIAVPEIGVRAYGRGDRASSSASDVHDMLLYT